MDYVQKCLNGNKFDVDGAARQLVEHAVHKLNSNDNVTVGWPFQPENIVATFYNLLTRLLGVRVFSCAFTSFRTHPNHT